MRGLARLFLERGATVSGSDMGGAKTLAALLEEGVRVTTRHLASNLDFDRGLVVASAAIDERNPEVVSAREKGLPVAKYAQVLGALAEGRRLVAVAGCHGKTSTAAMLAYALRELGADPSWVIGGDVPQLGGSAREGKGEAFVVEACEYDRSFLNFEPEVAVVTNLDRDHLETFGDFAGVVRGFQAFVDRIRPGGALLVGAADGKRLTTKPGVEKLLVAVGKPGDVRASGVLERDGRHAFRLSIRGRAAGDCRLAVPGRFQVGNAACAIAAAARLGLDPRGVARALSAFEGAERRFTRLGEPGGVPVVDDYAHHPTEIAATLAAAKRVYPDRRIVAVFQPHQYRRTRALLDEFSKAFADADLVVLDRIFRARDTEADVRSVSSSTLAHRLRERGKRVEYRPDHFGLVALLEAIVQPQDVVLTLGAGDIDSVGRELVSRLTLRPAGSRIPRPIYHPSPANGAIREPAYPVF
jgi:UDP-N-acetylmuramate--alanine ligase